MILNDAKSKIAIQTKRYTENNYVSNTAIQEVIGGSIFYGCGEKWVITTSFFTSSAIQLADVADVKLFNRNDLYNLVVKGLKKNNKILEIIEDIILLAIIIIL